ncbi:MAG: hypothetical protein ACMG6E_06800 [Candidatus Roizmanbacteria bacterium]
MRKFLVLNQVPYESQEDDQVRKDLLRAIVERVRSLSLPELSLELDYYLRLKREELRR